MSASCWYTGIGSQNCTARSNTFFRLSSVPYMFSRFSRATHTFSFSCSSLEQHRDRGLTERNDFKQRLTSIWRFYSPERDGFEGPLSHGSGLLDLRGLQVMSHVLQPEQGAVGRGQKQPLEGGRVLGPQVWIHQLGFPLHQGSFCRLLLLLQLMVRLLLGLGTDGR